MNFEIKYESTGGISIDDRMRDYQYFGYGQSEDYFPDDVNIPDFTTTSYIDDNARRMFHREFYQPYHVNQVTMNNVRRRPSNFIKTTNYLNVTGRNMVYQQVRSNYQNFNGEGLRRQYYQPNMNRNNYDRNSYYNRFPRYSPYIAPPKYGKPITRCCCCGRNRIYDMEVNNLLESSLYNQRTFEPTYSELMNRQVIAQRNYVEPPKCFVKTDVLKEQRVMHYEGQEVVASKSALSLHRIITQERIYTQLNDIRNIDAFDESLSGNVRMYPSSDEPKNAIRESLLTSISVQSDKNDGENALDITICETPSFLLSDTNHQLSTTFPQDSSDLLEEIYSPVYGEGENNNSFFSNYQDSILASLIKESDGEKQDRSLYGEPLNINTQDLCRFVSEELKKYSVSQSTFAKRVLNRSQGTLSDILRKPKPWSRLKTGKDTFVKMYEWSLLPDKERFRILKEGVNFKIFEGNAKSRKMNEKKY
uniref:Homeobox protein onecut (inferred by orthology to a D. melanogaster protein) n=1 Tax=Strongyloides venezuelensis TaxID=75913 RepID=A0A0K0FM47_STRVS